MKSLNDYIGKLTTPDLKKLAEILDIEKSRDTSAQVSRQISTHRGLGAVLGSLGSDEYNVFSQACLDEKGITFSQLESSLRIDSGRIEEISVALSHKLLVYVLKNRQRLHNRYDKIIVFHEIRELFNPQGAGYVARMFRQASDALLGKDWTPDPSAAIPKKHKDKTLLDYLMSRGGLAPLEEAMAALPRNTAGETLSRLLDSGAASVVYDPSYPPCALIALAPDSFLSIIQEKRLMAPENPGSSHNHYGFILNMFGVFDAVSTFGLFLTKQREFRKTDMERVMRNINPLYDIDGSVHTSAQTVKLLLHVMYHINLLKPKGDSITATLKPLQNELDRPDNILLKIIYQTQNAAGDNPLFAAPMALPSLRLISFIMEVLARIETAGMDYLRSAAAAKLLAESSEDHMAKTVTRLGEFMGEFKNAVSFMHLAGMIKISSGLMGLSDIGRALAPRLIKFIEPAAGDSGKSSRSIYINPDFSILIPRDDISSEDLYHILTHAEVIKDDVALSVRITRESVLNAYKRGMSQERFIEALTRRSKNPIPQNLSFMLDEWAKQTVRISIRNALLLKSNQPSFIDYLAAGKLKHALVERLSPNYAIIDREHLDELLKVSQGKDALISLFEDVD